MEKSCESNSSLTKPNRDNILAQGQYSVQLMPNKAFKKNQKPKTKNMAVMQAIFQYFVHHSTKICLPLQL